MVTRQSQRIVSDMHGENMGKPPGPYNQDNSILESILGPLILGNYQIG